MPEMGEYLVGAYLREILGCEIVVYNQRLSKNKGAFGELDVLGIDGNSQTVSLCEVTTHLGGVLYSGGGTDNSALKVESKFHAARDYAERAFPRLRKRYFFWAPRVRSGLLKQLRAIGPKLDIEIELIVQFDTHKESRSSERRRGRIREIRVILFIGRYRLSSTPCQ